MDRAVYCIVEARKGWVIKFNGKEFGPAPTREAALRAALRVASRARELSYHAQIVVLDSGVFRTVWVNGRNLLARAV